MDIDEALEVVGGYKRWNLLAFSLLSLSMFIPLCFQGLSIVYTGWIPSHHCKVPDGQWLNQTIPQEVQDGETVLSSCYMYTNYSIDNSTTECIDGWEYESDGYSTIVTDFDLVCKGKILSEMSQVIYQGGCLMAECLCSYFIDKFGRKKVHLTGVLLSAVFGTGAAFSPNYITFVALRSVTGMFVVASLISGITMLMEIFDSKRRGFAGIGLEAGWVFTYISLPLLAYLITDWRVLQGIISAISFVWIIYIWILPESAAWYAAYNRYDEAEEVLQEMARWNGVKPKNKIKLHRPYRSSDYLRDGKPRASVMSIMSVDIQEALQGVRVPVRDLFTDPKLRIHLLISCCLWFANCVVYYYLILSSPSLGRNRFLSFFYMGLVEIPAYFISFFIVEKVGRKIPLLVYHIMAGGGLLAVAFIPEKTSSGVDLQPLLIFVALVAKFGITSSFAVLVLYTKELFPASLRGTSSGIYLACGRIGNMVTPFAVYGARQIFWLPNFLCAIISTLAGLSVLFLPETMGTETPLTTEDVHTIFYNESKHGGKAGEEGEEDEYSEMMDIKT